MMQLLHPYMPFITEEIYHLLRDQSVDLCIKQQTTADQVNKGILDAGELLKQVISALRDARNKNQIKPKDPIKLHIETNQQKQYESIAGILSKQINAASIDFETAVSNTIVVAVEKDKFFIETERQLDTTALKSELLKDLEYQKNFRDSVMKKLGNERFVQNAKPEVVALEQKKLADAEARIQNIEESLKNL
jgi:valyl-tRNA synthetase